MVASKGVYRTADLSAFADRTNAPLFHDESYDPVLSEMIAHILMMEAPISDTLLIERIRKAHGFGRAGRLIRDRVLDLVEKHHCLRDDPVGGRFVWPDKDAPAKWACYREPATKTDVRWVEDLCFEELRAASLKIKGNDKPIEIARTFGIDRLSAQSRERIEAVLRRGDPLPHQ